MNLFTFYKDYENDLLESLLAEIKGEFKEEGKAFILD